MDTYQYDIVKNLSFMRFGGTDGEKKAADYLLSEIKALGGEGRIEEFQIPAYEFKSYSVKATSPYEREYDVLPWGLSGSTPEGGATLELFYAEDCSEAALYGRDDLSGKAVLVNDLTRDAYRRLCERKAGAILVIKGNWYESGENSDFLLRHIRPTYAEFGKIPTFFIWAKDAAEMVENEVKTLHITLEQEELTHTSRNVVATVKGSESGEALIVTAHYDSVSCGTGSLDNATGSATAMYIYRYFLNNQPRRDIHFVWCGSEEQGLLGSKAFVEAHPELIEKEIRLGFNFDMCGTILGVNKICVTGTEELKNYAEAFCREYGLNASVYQDVHSSDSAPLADKGIPTVDIIRVTGTAEIHTRHDLIDTVSPKQLKRDGDFSVAIISRVANSVMLPVETGMPDDMKKKLDKYFQRDQKSENKEEEKK